jgi:hypothetical protein
MAALLSFFNIAAEYAIAPALTAVIRALTAGDNNASAMCMIFTSFNLNAKYFTLKLYVSRKNLQAPRGDLYRKKSRKAVLGSLYHDFSKPYPSPRLIKNIFE